ncbi:aspartyl protease family protein [Winogradskyella sp. PG-2]|uniref:aspartyl protease family protein n=1 Tax=Winogradskyella sp. PG-2 TaxID=754409 RepID=UPI001493FA45|nr:aspartyl protease family protein [Winogradskyella sp. PG-2]
MKLVFTYILPFFLLLNFWVLPAQSEFLLDDKVSEKIHFEFTSNLIIIPLEINSVELSFVLDTGVNKPILFNLLESDLLSLKDTETFFLHGLGGDGKIEALKSSHNEFKIGNAINTDQDLFVVFDKTINFTPRLGILVHGIIGYDVFKNFVVEINYNAKYIRLHKPEYFKPKTSKKCKTLPLNLYRGKAYIDGEVNINDAEKHVKLLIDTGSSDALWLFEDESEGFSPNKSMFFVDYLGKGLSGSVYGKRSKVNNFELGDFNMENVNVAFPDSVSIDLTKTFKGRNGSLGGDILKRFNLFFDYTNEKLHLKKNSFYKASFTYNNSGIVLEYNGNMFVEEQIKLPNSSNFTNSKRMDAVQINQSFNYIMTLKPVYEIVEIRTSSNAYKAGLRNGDVLLTINSKAAYNYKLQEISEILHGKTGKTIRVKIGRKGEDMVFKFKLDDVFKTNEPSN